MKNIFILFLIPVAISGCKQKTPVNKKAEVFNSKSVRMIKDTSVMMLIENVEVSYGDFYAKGDSALLDKITKMVTVYGPRNATFKGKAITEKGTRLKYVKGEDHYHAE